MLIATIAVVVFFWNKARKEIVFLCSNFKQGVSDQSVRRQLDTGDFLRYKTESQANGSRMIVDSVYNLSMLKCVIDFDTSSIVQESHLQ